MKLGQIKVRERERDGTGQGARIDGIFGPLTREDVIEFQADTGLDADGVVGPRTWNALDSLVTGTAGRGRGARAQRCSSTSGIGARACRAVRRGDRWRSRRSGWPHQDDARDGGDRPVRTSVLCNHQRGRFGIAVSVLRGRHWAARFNQEAIGAGSPAGEPRAGAPDQRSSGLSPPPDSGARSAARRRHSRGRRRRWRHPRRELPAQERRHWQPTWTCSRASWLNMIDRAGRRSCPTATTCSRSPPKPSRRRARSRGPSGCDQTGEADAATWHALDSFTHGGRAVLGAGATHWDRNAEATRLRQDRSRRHQLPLLRRSTGMRHWRWG